MEAPKLLMLSVQCPAAGCGTVCSVAHQCIPKYPACPARQFAGAVSDAMGRPLDALARVSVLRCDTPGRPLCCDGLAGCRASPSTHKVLQAKRRSHPPLSPGDAKQ